jgi:N-acetylglucosamine kinase-like BadF-type ATPase
MVARRADGREPSANPALGRLICTALNIESPAGLVAAVYTEGMDRARIARLAEVVVAAADEDDSIFSEILRPAGLELATMIVTVVKKLRFEARIIPLGFAGSFLLNCPFVARVVTDRLSSLGYEIKASLVANPVEGALILARRGLDCP